MHRETTTWLARLMLVLIAPAALAVSPDREISQYAHSMWTLQEGLLPGAPTDIGQATDGYLWIGTRGGLVRFDGVRFVPFAPAEGPPLRSSRILSLRPASDGTLWIGTRWGLHRYREGHLFDYTEAQGSVSSIFEDRTGRIWFTRARMVGETGPLCEVQGDKAKCYGSADGVSIVNARQLSADSEGNFWIVSDDELLRWKEGAARTWLPPGVTQTDRAKAMDVLQSVVARADGSIWVGATQPNRGLGLLHLADDRLQPFVAPQLDGRTLSISLVFVDKHDALWIGTQDDGLYRWHDGKVSQFRAKDGLSADTVQNIFEDREGTLWVLTTRGIDAFRDLRVNSVSSREGLTADLANGVLARRDGSIWIDTWHSIDILASGKITTLKKGHGLPGDEVMALFEDRSGTLWAGIDSDLAVLDGDSFHVIRQTDGNPLGSVQAITDDARGDLWAVTARPDFLWHIRDRTVLEGIARSTIPFAFGAILDDAHGGIWLPLRNGDLGRYADGKLETIPFHREVATGIINGLVSTSDGSIVGSTSVGLIGWRNGETRTMTAAVNGLPCEDIHALLLDRHEALWMYASCGVIVLAPDALQAWWNNASQPLDFRVFDALDGAQPARGNFFPRASVAVDGRLWFANASIAQVVDPEHLGGNTLPPPVHIERVVADRTVYGPENGLRLPPNPRDLEIGYTGLSMAIPRKTLFRYRLEGHDADWHDVGNRREAFYTDLPPGDYRFRVIASNNDGVWNEAGASLEFSVAPTFYQTRLFAVACIVASIAAMWLLFLLRARQIEARMRVRLEERLVERERIAREMHDTLLQGLVSASMQLAVANEQIAPDAAAKPLVERILRLLRRVVEEGRNALRGLRDRESGPGGLERAFARIAQELAVDGMSEHRVVVEGEPRSLRPFVCDEVYRIGCEALANAFRHAHAPRIETVLTYADRHFRLVVRDNGCGMSADVARSGRDGHWGIPGMRERTKKVNGALRVFSALGEGTEIELIVPGAYAFAPGGSRQRAELAVERADEPI